MFEMEGNVEQETISLENGEKQVISYLDDKGNLQQKYSYNAVNMLIQTYDSNDVLIKEELKENPHRDKMEESEHYKEYRKTMKELANEKETLI
jgi:hypothetical protein